MDVDDPSDDSTSTKVSSSQEDPVPALPRDYTLDCAICLQPFVQPVQLPCSHTFCFLCAKGIALQRQPCALCRADIPLDLLTKPTQFKATNRHVAQTTGGTDDPNRFVWYYQGHKGWWQYDERTTTEIEEAFLNKEKNVDILIAGAIYVIDFEAMIQYQRNTNSRKRKIKRDSLSAQKKGVAGMTVPTPAAQSESQTPGTSADDEGVHKMTTRTRKAPLGDGGSGDS